MSTPPIPSPNATPNPDVASAGDQRPEAPAQGMAPHKGEMLDQGMQATAQTSAPSPAPAPAPMIHEGAVYRTPDGEERLAWVVRHGVVEYFARRDRGRWTPTLFDRGCPRVEDFAREVGMLAPVAG